MKTAGVYFKIGDTFIDSGLNVKAECVDDMNVPCDNCIYEFTNNLSKEYNICTDKNTPLCLDIKREDNTDVKFIKKD